MTEQEDREALAALIRDWAELHEPVRSEVANARASMIVACGYRRPPSREALSEVLMSIYDHGTQPNALREADAVLALWKEGNET